MVSLAGTSVSPILHNCNKPFFISCTPPFINPFLKTTCWICLLKSSEFCQEGSNKGILRINLLKNQSYLPICSIWPTSWNTIWVMSSLPVVVFPQSGLMQASVAYPCQLPPPHIIIILSRCSMFKSRGLFSLLTAIDRNIWVCKTCQVFESLSKAGWEIIRFGDFPHLGWHCPVDIGHAIKALRNILDTELWRIVLT